MKAIWPDTVVEENDLTQNISLLRRLLGERRDEHRYIVTVPGSGYRFVADVKTFADENGREEANNSQSKVEQFDESGAQPAQVIGTRKNRVWLVAVAGLIVGIFTTLICACFKQSLRFHFNRCLMPSVSLRSHH